MELIVLIYYGVAVLVVALFPPTKKERRDRIPIGILFKILVQNKQSKDDDGSY